MAKRHYNRYHNTDKTIRYDVVIPGGFTLDEIVEQALSLLMRKFPPFAYYDIDDLRQEVAVTIYKAAEKYDANKVKNSPKQYYFVCVTNRLKNLQRDVASKIIDDAQGGHIHETEEEEHVPDNSFLNDIMTKDLIDYVTSRMPDKFSAAFLSMLYGGGKEISSYKKGEVRKRVRILIKRYKDE